MSRRSKKRNGSNKQSKRKRNINRLMKSKDSHEQRNTRIQARRESTVNTTSFRSKQSFGAASECRSVP